MSKNDGYITYNEHVAFWGSLLSNFGECFFELDGRHSNGPNRLL